MNILVTGNMGYVGSMLPQVLAREIPGASIFGFDSGFFGHCLSGSDLLPEYRVGRQYFSDVRDITQTQIAGIDAVIHLAALSNDPIGNEFEEVTDQINNEAAVNLVRLASKSGVKNFVFASSCSMYGQASGPARRETDPLNPLTAYARSKVAVEEAVKCSDIGEMIFTSLRFATACGWSSRLRLDLVLNDFVASAIASKQIIVLSDGTPWRPLIDIEDMCRAMIWGVKRRVDQGGQFLAINAGSNENNYQVKDIADAVARQVPGTAISINKDALPDKRSYSVDFTLFEDLASSYLPRISLEQSIGRLKNGLLQMGFVDSRFRESDFIRLNTIRKHVQKNRLGADLRWR